jgi:hypothetical protein
VILRLEQSWWSCAGLAIPEESWLEHIAAGGFDAVHRRVPDAAWLVRCRALGLRWSATAILGTAAAITEEVARAADGGADWMNLQLREDEPADVLLDAVAAAEARYRLPLRVETHRGRITQDLRRTCAFLQARPSLRLTLDLSHYVVANEFQGDTSAFAPLFPAAGALHLRVSNGEQVQVPLVGNEVAVERFCNWWRSALAGAAARGEAWFPAVCELGPPPYAIRDQAGRELSDRWAETMTLANRLRAG